MKLIVIEALFNIFAFMYILLIYNDLLLFKPQNRIDCGLDQFVSINESKMWS